VSVKKIDRPFLNQWVDKLISKGKVVGPQARRDQYEFDELKMSSELALDYDISKLPPKKFIFPQTEVLMKFKEGGKFESALDNEPFVLFGVHPYDMSAINQMDAFFTTGQIDPNYKARREAATLVVLDSDKPPKNTFASSMGTATVKEGFDVIITRVNGSFLIDSRTKKGEALLAELKGAPDAKTADLKEREKVWEKNSQAFNKWELKCKPTDLPKLLEGSYDHPVWEEMSKRCFSCGSCNLVCPTCYCFDVRDDVSWDLKGGDRYRVWDGCMLTEFAMVAGNHNFRKNRKERYRHRFFRKGKYLWDRLKQISCVGCGRCTTVCVTNIANPVEVYNKLVETKK